MALSQSPAYTLALLWPDDFNAFICYAREPRVLMRIEPLAGNQVRLRILRHGAGLNKLSREKRCEIFQGAIDYAIETNLIEKPDSFTVVRSIDMPLSDHLVLLAPAQNDDEDDWLAAIHTDTLSFADCACGLTLVALFQERQMEVVAYENEEDDEDEEDALVHAGVTAPKPKKTSTTGSNNGNAGNVDAVFNQFPELKSDSRVAVLVEYEGESDYRSFRDATRQPETLAAWRQKLNEIRESLKAKPEFMVQTAEIDAVLYLRWLAASGEKMSLKTQIRFLQQVLGIE